jgi:hypothetical protein
MSEYMLLLYAPEADEAEDAKRLADLPAWNEVAVDLREAGMLVSNGPLSPVSSATTLRVRDDEVELTDGPFAVTKEVLVGYFLLECPDLDEALKAAARLPAARYGSIEVRPMREMPAEAAAGGS